MQFWWQCVLVGSPPPNFSFLLTFSSHTQRALRDSEKQQLWQAMLTCQPALSNSFGQFSNVTLALSISFKSGASLLTAAWERESPGAKAGKSSLGGWWQQESLVVPVSQPSHPLLLLIPATYRQVQAGKIPSFDCEERACLCHHNNLCFPRMKSHQAWLQKSWDEILLLNPWHSSFFSLGEK